jgi:signal transduction histidine kinase/PAS domain-containing protein
MKSESKKSYNISIEIKLFQKQHSSVWAELTASLILDHFGEVVGYQGIIRNIDAQKRTLEILEKRNQKYNFAIKSVGSGVWELNADLTHINIDENLLNILGYNKNEKKPFLNEWINLTYKEDRIFIIDILQDILDGKRFSASYDCRRIHKNEKILWFSDYVEAIYNSDGKIIELLGTSKNITNEKLTEEKKFRYYAGLQLLIESTFQFLKFNSPEHIYNYAGKILVQNIPDSLIVFSTFNPQNHELKPLRFFSAQEQKLIKQLVSLSNKNDSVCVKINPKIQKLLAQKFLIECESNDECLSQIFNDEIKNTIKNSLRTYRLYIIGIGSEGHITDSISIISKDNSEILNKEFIEAFISLFAIILDKKKIELELKKTNETKDKFFSIISHDLKNPFNTIIGFSGLIIQNIEKISSEKILEFVKLIHDAALLSHEMMQNLFEWVNSQKGTMICRPVKIDINGLIAFNIKLFSSEAVKKEISMEFNNGKETDFYADIDMLNTVIRNLISNALKFTNTGGKVKVSYELTDHEVLFSVLDNGVGIQEEKQKTIFKMISNKSTSGTNMEKGTGLGLILCEEFVHLNGGKIWVESKQGKGSSFKFTIPLKK